MNWIEHALSLDDDDTDAPASAAPAAPDAAPGAGRKLRYSDADFLRIVGDERRRSVGFGDGDTGELAKVRIRAQEYRRGEIRDLPVMAGRSKAVDSTLSDTVDTLMPDIMEVFFGGDDVVTFDAQSEADEPQAREESEAVTFVVFSQNDAFRAFHDAIQDALLNRTGLFHWWWEENEKPIGSMEAGSPLEAAMVAQLIGQRAPWAQANVEQRDDGSVSLELAELRGRVCIKAVPSEDFTAAADTITLRETAYCALRDRPRVQDLIARGIDKTLARSLPRYTSKNDGMAWARDESGENDREGEDGIDDMRVVEVRTHYLRVDADDDGDVEIWRVETDSEETTLLRKEEVSQIPFGALTPYLNAHRFYGESLYDKLAEVMRIKTVLLRMMLDSGYFALNQRMEVSEEASSEFTISDLLNNAPNVPVRSKTGQAVRPLQAGQLGFDVFNAIEFMSVQGEQRSGVVRNAQGLNPDTLHDTASGMQQLVAAANKRVRMICRVMAETGVKDLFLGVHRMLREQTTDQHAPLNMKAGRSWKQLRPNSWDEREALTVHVGVGSSGTDKNLQVQEAALNLTKEVIQLQGGSVQGPFVTAQNVYARLKAFSRAAGEKDPDLYWSDPATAAQNGQAGGPQAPHPDLVKAQSEAQIAAAKLQADTQAQAQQQQADQALAVQKMQGEMRLKLAEMQQEMALERQKMLMEIQLEREKAANDLRLQQQEAEATIALKRQQIAMGASRSASVAPAVDALPGGPG